MSYSTLDSVNKMLANVMATSTTRQPWQEDYARLLVTSAQTQRFLQNWIGSWAAAANRYSTQETDAFGTTNNNSSLIVSQLGRPGLPEINFVPYSWGTNQPTSYMGHPISYSIVGPTLRHPTTNWQWQIDKTNNTLILDAVSFDGSTLHVSTLEQIYGLTEIPMEGLYCVVSQTGNPGQLFDGDFFQGGIGDGFVNTVGLRKAIQNNASHTSFEIFRVKTVDWTSTYPDAKIVLEPTKKLSDYFTIPVAPKVPVARAITLFKPYATRLQQVSDTTFLVMTPEQSAASDGLPARGETTIPGSWLGGSFAAYDQSLVGAVPTYGGSAKLPVFQPKGSGQARLQTNRYQSAEGLPFEPGVVKLSDYTGTVAVGDIVHVTQIIQPNPAVVGFETVYEAYHDAGLLDGYFEVLELVAAAGSSPAHLRCLFLPQQDAETGNLYYGPSVLQANFDFDGTPVSAKGYVQVVSPATDPAGTAFSITVRDRTVSHTYTYTTVAINENALTIATGLKNAISGDPNVTATLDGANNAVILTANTAGVVGNSVAFTHSTASTVTTLKHSGTYLGQNDPSVGYTGLSPVVGKGLGVDAYKVLVSYTIHDPVEALYTSTYLDPQKVQGNRLTNLIDPSWNQGALSKLSTVQSKTTLGRADKAIFNTGYKLATTTAEDPGSLLDLGFRMVLFPARLNHIGEVCPDFDRPITGSNVVLNPNSHTQQYLMIDYVAGAVILSEPAEPGAGCTIAPSGILGTTTNNVRGEIVLYAACVPFSRMPSQQEAGVEVTTTETQALPNYADTTYRATNQVGLLGQRVVRKIARTFSGAAQTLHSQDSTQVLYLEDVDAPQPTGMNEVSLTFAAPLDGDTLSISLYTSEYRVTLTAKAAPTTENHFLIGASNIDTAANLVTCIAAHTKISQVYYAVADGVGGVTLHSRAVGAAQNTSKWPFPTALTSFGLSTSAPARIVLASAALAATGTTSTLPPTGFIEIVEGTGVAAEELRFSNADSTPKTAATFQYTKKEIVWDPTAVAFRTKLSGVFGGRRLGDNIVLSTKQHYAVLRKSTVLPNDAEGNTGTSYQEDTQAGFAIRNKNLHFPGASLTMQGDQVLVDYSGAFVEKYGSQMSGSLVITVTPDNGNPQPQANQPGLQATGDGTGVGVYGIGGADGISGVVGAAGTGSNGAGVVGAGDGTGAGITGTGGASNGDGVAGTGIGTGAGVSGTGGATGVGVYGAGARGVVAVSASIADYPQAQIRAAGTAIPTAKAKGDIWVPSDTGVDWDGHLLVYSGVRYLDPCASILRKQLFTATIGAYSLSAASFLTGDSFDTSITPYAQTQKFQATGAGSATIWWEAGVDNFYNGLSTGSSFDSALVYRCKTSTALTYKVVLNRYRSGVLIGVLTVKTGSTNNGTLTTITATTTEISSAGGFGAWGTLATMLQAGDTFYIGLEIDFTVAAQNVYFYDMYYNHYEVRHAAY